MSESKPKASVLSASHADLIGTALAVTPGWLAAYVPDARRYDELLDDKGSIRPHWRATAGATDRRMMRGRWPAADWSGPGD